MREKIYIYIVVILISNCFAQEPIATMINFEENNNNSNQEQLHKNGHYDLDGTFIPSNQINDEQLNIDSASNLDFSNDPNNFMLIGNTINVNDNKPTVTYNVEIANNDESSDLIIDDKVKNIEDQNNNNTNNQQQNQENEIEDQNNCIIIFSECNYKGDSLKLCETASNIDDFNHDIKSIVIPQGYSIRLYNQDNFEGDDITIKESQACLLKPLSLIQLFGNKSQQFNILIQNKMNLRYK